MKCDIICRGGKVILIPTDYKENNSIIITLLINELNTFIGYNTDKSILNNLNFSDETMERLNVARVVYEVDRLKVMNISYNNWSRCFILQLPVINSGIWERAKETVESPYR